MWLGISSAKTEPADKHFTVLRYGCSVWKLKICLRFSLAPPLMPIGWGFDVWAETEPQQAPRSIRWLQRGSENRKGPRIYAFPKIISFISFHWPPFPSTSITRNKHCIKVFQNYWSCLLNTAFEEQVLLRKTKTI